jgi:tRNA threonylcarbamoyladenosine biosynthesis protein TsaE
MSQHFATFGPIYTVSPYETQELAARLGEKAEIGTIIGLSGELGAGKTCFVQGLARGLGVDAKTAVVSPSYTLVNEYPSKIPLFHLDLYRISAPDELEFLGFRDFLDKGVLAIEWFDTLRHHLLLDRLEVFLEIKEEKRKIKIEAFGEKMCDFLHRAGLASLQAADIDTA